MRMRFSRRGYSEVQLNRRMVHEVITWVEACSKRRGFQALTIQCRSLVSTVATEVSWATRSKNCSALEEFGQLTLWQEVSQFNSFLGANYTFGIEFSLWVTDELRKHSLISQSYFYQRYMFSCARHEKDQVNLATQRTFYDIWFACTSMAVSIQERIKLIIENLFRILIFTPFQFLSVSIWMRMWQLITASASL